MNRILGVAAAAIWAATATGGWAGGLGAVGPATPAARGAHQIAGTSEPDLRRQVTIAGQPRAVLWAAERLWPANPDAFPPPVRRIMCSGRCSTMARPTPWPRWSAAVRPRRFGSTRRRAFRPCSRPALPLDVFRHHGTQGFMDADVMTVPAAPGLILLERRSC